MPVADPGISEPTKGREGRGVRILGVWGCLFDVSHALIFYFFFFESKMNIVSIVCGLQ